MFTYVKLKNYKSLVDFEVDLTSSKNNPKKMIIIYGENGAGKSNFINAFFTLFET
ncbi:AAA family ATPase, partial [Brachyspira murdochii]